MIWALIFTLLFGNNEPLYVIPNIDKHIKKNVTDQNRKNQLLENHKASKKIRKEYQKARNKFNKDFKDLSLSINSTKSEFQELTTAFSIQRADLQKRECILIIKSRKLITPDEWKLILQDSKKDIKKEIKRTQKNLEKTEKNFHKAFRLIDSKVVFYNEKEYYEPIIKEIFNAQELYIKTYLEFLNDDSSALYAQTISPEELETLLNDFSKMRDEIYIKIMNAHFMFKDKSSKKQWKKLIKKADF